MSILRSPLSAEKNPEVKKEETPQKQTEMVNKKDHQMGRKEKPAIKVKKFKKRLPSFYVPLIIAFIFSLLLLGGIIFTYRQLVTLSDKTEQSRGQVMALRDRELSLKKLSSDFQSVQSEIEVIDQALPNEEGIVNFVKKFKEISQDVSVEVFNFQTDQPNSDSVGNYFIDFDVELKGSFDNLKNFLTKLIKLPYLIRLRIVDIDQTDQDESKMVVGARIFVSSLFFKEEKK